MSEEEIIANLEFIKNNLYEISQKTALKETIIKFKKYLYQNQTADVQFIVKIIWGKIFAGYSKGKNKARSKLGDADWFFDFKNFMIEQEFFLDCQFKNGFSLLTKFMHKPRDTAIEIIKHLQNNNGLSYVVAETKKYATFTKLVNSLYRKLQTNMSESTKRPLREYLRLAIKINKEIKDPNHKFLSTSLIENCLTILDSESMADNITVDTDKNSILRFTTMKRMQTPELLDFLESKRPKLISQ